MTTTQGSEALLHWCRTNTNGYPDVLVQNFSSSWMDGLALCALIHKFHPEDIQFESLNKDNPLDTLEIAFSVAAKHGVPRLLDPADMVPKPDSKYLSQMYHVFEKNAHPALGIANITMEGVPSKPRLMRSVSQPQMPKMPGNLFQPRGTIPKFTPPVKKAASVASLADVITPLDSDEITLPTPKSSPIGIPLSTNGLSSKSSNSVASSAPIAFRSASTSSISVLSSSASVKSATIPNGYSKSSGNDSVRSDPPIIYRSTPSPSPSPSPVPPSPSPSPTPPKFYPLSSKSANEITTLKIISPPPSPAPAPVSSPTNATVPSSLSLPPSSPSPSPSPLTSPLPSPKVDDKDEKAKSSTATPARPTETKLKRSQSTSSVAPGWVAKIKMNTNFVKITDPQRVEIKRAEREGHDESDDDAVKSQANPPQRRLLVDKVSSSSRSSWVASLQHKDDEDEDEDYDYFDDDPNRIYEPNFDCDFKLVSCLLRTTSTGKLTMPTASRSSKKVCFKDFASEEVKPQVATKPTATPELTFHSSDEPAKDLLTLQSKANDAIKGLEKERDAAVFHRDEMAARYAELEVRYKEERAANDAMERETADLHEKLAEIQRVTESKYVQQVSDMTQKLADKDREILRLRMQNTTMKKRVEEKERDLERMRSSRSISPIPELPPDLEADNECRKILESAQEVLPTKTVSVHSYGGLKISVEPNPKINIESPRSMTASPRYDLTKEAPFSPDLVRRTSTPPLLIKANTRSFTPTKGDSPDIQRHVEIAKTYIYSRPQTPTKPGEKKSSSRPETPTKVEIIKMKADSSAKPQSPDRLQRSDSQTRISVQIQSAKSPEPIKVVLSPKTNARPSANGTKAEESSSSGEGNAPGTPRAFTEHSQGLDPKLPKLDDPKTEYRAGTMRTEISKPIIVYTPSSSSQSPSPRPSHSPNASPSPSPKPTYKLPTQQPSKRATPPRHSSNPAPSPNPSPSPTSGRPSSNPSPSNTISTNSSSSNSKNETHTQQSALSSNSKQDFAHPKPEHQSRASSIFSFITRGRSNTLPTEMPGYERPKTEHHGLVSLQSPRGANLDNKSSSSSSADSRGPATLSQEEASQLSIGRSYSLSSLMPPKLTAAPSYIPTASQADIKPTWLINLGKKNKDEPNKQRVK